MARKDRKIMKKRGTRNCGRGRKGSRKKNSGRGMGGSQKHKYTLITSQGKKFGKKGMKKLNRTKKPKTVNIGYLSSYASKNNLKKLDVKTLGYEKVLGGGQVEQALTIHADNYTEKAKQKIEEAGGKFTGSKTVKE